MFAKLMRSTKAAALIEYVVLVGLIGVTTTFAVVQTGSTVRGVFVSVESTVDAETQRALQQASNNGNGSGNTPPPSTPPTPTGACVELDEDLLQDLYAGNVDSTDLGITDCIDLSWGAGEIYLDHPGFSGITGPFVVHIGTSGLPTIAGYTAVNLPPMSVSVVFSGPPNGGSASFSTSGGTVNAYFDGVATNDLVLTYPTFNNEEIHATWPNGTEVRMFNNNTGDLNNVFANNVAHPNFPYTPSTPVVYADYATDASTGCLHEAGNPANVAWCPGNTHTGLPSNVESRYITDPTDFFAVATYDPLGLGLYKTPYCLYNTSTGSFILGPDAGFSCGQQGPSLGACFLNGPTNSYVFSLPFPDNNPSGACMRTPWNDQFVDSNGDTIETYAPSPGYGIGYVLN